MPERWHNALFLLLVLAVLIGIGGVVATQDRPNIPPRAAMRTIDPLLIDRQLREGHLSKHPARHFRVLDGEGG